MSASMSQTASRILLTQFETLAQGRLDAANLISVRLNPLNSIPPPPVLIPRYLKARFSTQHLRASL